MGFLIILNDVKKFFAVNKGIESLPQTQIFLSLNRCNLMVLTFDISNLDYLI